MSRPFVRSAVAAATAALLLVGTFAGASAAEPPSWGPTEALSTVGQDSRGMKIAVSADGTKATVIWTTGDGVYDVVQTRSATLVGNTATWGPVTTLADVTYTASDPDVEVSADGTRATAVWWRFNGSRRVMQSRSATIAGNVASWGAVSNLSDSTLDVINVPRLVLSADGGTATAVWVENDSSYRVQSSTATVSGATATWTPWVNLSDDGGDASYPRISASTDGSKVTVVWVRHDGAADRVQARSSSMPGTGSGSWGAVTDLSDPGKDAASADIAVSNDGARAIAVWTRFNGAVTVVQSKSAGISGSTATWGDRSDLSEASQSARFPDVEVSGDGAMATVVWDWSDGVHRLVQAASATVAGPVSTWSGRTDLSDSSQNAVKPRLALSDDGSVAVAVWIRWNGTFDVIQTSSASVVSFSSVWSAPTDLSDTSTGTVGVAMSPSHGLVAAVWQGGTLFSYQIQARFYAGIADLPPTGAGTSDLVLLAVAFVGVGAVLRTARHRRPAGR